MGWEKNFLTIQKIYFHQIRLTLTEYAATCFLKCGQILSDVPNPSRLAASHQQSCHSSTVQLATPSIPCTRCAPTRTIRKITSRVQFASKVRPSRKQDVKLSMMNCYKKSTVLQNLPLYAVHTPPSKIV